MSGAEIIALLQLASVLVPEATKLINNLQTAVNTNGSIEDRMKMLIDLQGALKPMQLKP